MPGLIIYTKISNGKPEGAASTAVTTNTDFVRHWTQVEMPGAVLSNHVESHLLKDRSCSWAHSVPCWLSQRRFLLRKLPSWRDPVASAFLSPWPGCSLLPILAAGWRKRALWVCPLGAKVHLVRRGQGLCIKARVQHTMSLDHMCRPETMPAYPSHCPPSARY